MFYCELCRVKMEWPQSFGGSHGPCEVCGVTSNCYDIPSKYLPLPKEEINEPIQEADRHS